jgi:hypothetical protein
MTSAFCGTTEAREGCLVFKVKTGAGKVKRGLLAVKPLVKFFKH